MLLLMDLYCDYPEKCHFPNKQLLVIVLSFLTRLEACICTRHLWSLNGFGLRRTFVH